MKHIKERLKLSARYLFGLLSHKINGTHVIALIAKTDNGLFAVDPEDYGVGRNLRMNGKYGVDEIERLKPFLASDSKVLIVGAHIGTLAIPISKLCKSVVAVEANPDTCELLRKNILLNDVSNCKTVNIAASNKKEVIRFLMSKANSGGSKRVPINKEYMYYYDKPKEISVIGFDLDGYFENDEFDVIVMDIEGSEYFALQGMQRILSKSKLLAIEFLPHHLKNVSGVTVAQFLSLIEPHFCRLTIPTKNKTLEAKDFHFYLSEMYYHDQRDEAILFQKDVPLTCPSG